MFQHNLPPGYSKVGEFKGADGYWNIERERFLAFLERLRQLSSSHTLDQRFIRGNGGSASNPYRFSEVPRAIVRDGQGELELLVEAYDEWDGHVALIGIYSDAPVRARRLLEEHFAPNEFGDHTPIVSSVEISDGTPAEDVIEPPFFYN